MKTEAKEECKDCVIKEIINSDLGYCIHIRNQKTCEDARKILLEIDERRKQKQNKS